MESTEKDKKYYPALTGIRAIAAFMVFLCHNNPVDHYAFSKPGKEWLRQLFGDFDIGVTIFFVLSGFLISARYKDNLKINRLWFSKYLRNRFARIYPLYFVVTILTLIASQLSSNYDPSKVWGLFNLTDKVLVVIMNLTLLRGFFSNFIFTMAGQGWSLTVEECFYLSAPFIIIIVNNRKSRIAYCGIVTMATGFLLVFFFSKFHDLFYGFFNSLKFMLSWTYFGHCPEFLIGMFLSMIIDKFKICINTNKFITIISTFWIFFCMCLMVELQKGLSPEIFGPVNRSYLLFVLIKNLILPIGIAGLLFGIIRENTWFSNMLKTKLFDTLGKSSYAFYLIHVGVLNFLIINIITSNIILKFIIMNIVAIGLYKMVEHPLHKILIKKLDLKLNPSPPR